jgi:hypothetical protein
VHWALDVIVQAVVGSELFGTEVAFLGLSVLGVFYCDSFDVEVTGQSDHGAGDDIIAVELVDHVVYFLAIEVRDGAATGFEAVGKSKVRRSTNKKEVGEAVCIRVTVCY